MMDVDVSNSIGNFNNNAPLNAPNAALSTFFIVQKCWFSGPTAVGMDVPTDYLRLLTTQQHAENIASLSAHAFNSSNSASNSNIGMNSQNNAPTPVRTIVLPDGGGYAFLAAGKIFWVRRVQATILSTPSSSSTPHAINNNDIHFNNMTAHAVVTEHVIGGTGNCNSRRGQEVATGRVFVGDGASSGQAAMVVAQHLAAGVQQQAGGTLPQGNVNIRVTWLPIGMPDENASNSNSHAHLQEWPDRHLWVQQHRQQHEQQQESCFKQQRDDSECSYYSVNGGGGEDANHVFGTSTNTASSMDTTAPNMFSAPPAAKRQCRQPDTVGNAASASSTWAPWATR
jgi:hypothetical protein